MSESGIGTIAIRGIKIFYRDLAPVLLAALCGCALSAPASAARIENGTAIFAALDKVTAKILELKVPLNETVRFGALKVTPRVCYSRPATEAPKTTTFVEVVEVLLDGRKKKLFTGWMFAESPGLNAVEHPVYDVWLTSCKNPGRNVRALEAPEAGTGAAAPPPRTLRRIRRRRIRR